MGLFILLMVVIGLFHAFEPKILKDYIGNIWLEYNVIGENRRDFIYLFTM